MSQDSKQPFASPAKAGTRELCRILVPWDVQRTNPNRVVSKMHHYDRNRLNRQAKEWAGLAWREAGEPRARGPVRLHIHSRRAKPIDIANIAAGAGPIINGLFKGQITPDDGPPWILSLTVTQETGTQFKGSESLEVIVYEEESA